MALRLNKTRPKTTYTSPMALIVVGMTGVASLMLVLAMVLWV